MAETFDACKDHKFGKEVHLYNYLDDSKVKVKGHCCEIQFFSIIGPFRQKDCPWGRHLNASVFKIIILVLTFFMSLNSFSLSSFLHDGQTTSSTEFLNKSRIDRVRSLEMCNSYKTIQSI